VYRLSVVATITDAVAVTVTITIIDTTTATTAIIITFTITAIPKRITLYDHHSINREQKEHTIIITLLYIDEQSCNQR
jgi:predicted PP-loop superfamily ATPase